LVAKLIEIFGRVDAKQFLESGKKGGFSQVVGKKDEYVKVA
jgi:hypothetical protein